MLKRWKPVESIDALGGEGVIAGELSGDPAVPDGLLTVNGVPTSREIEVRDHKSRRVVAVRRSNVDGTYRFPGLNPSLLYDVIARDFAGDYEDVIAGAVRPHTPDMLAPVAAGDKMAAFSDSFGVNVVSLLHFDGADGSTTFTDQTGKTWVAIGNVHIDTAQSKFGGASCIFDGNNDELYGAPHADFGFGTGDFTWEAWVRWAGGDQVIFDNRNSGSDLASFVVFLSQTGAICYFDTSTKTGSGAVVAQNSWTHIAISRASGTQRMFVGGTLVFSGTRATDMGSSRPMRIGRDAVGNADFNGWMDDVRITKGIAWYTENFTPPTAPFDL